MSISLDPDKGLGVPVKTNAEKEAIASPQPGAIVYDSTLNSFSGHNGVSWAPLGGGATGGGTSGNQIFYLNDQIITDNYTVPAGKNAGTFGEVTVATGVEVIVSNGSTWSIV